jgi:hypothetical protein
MMITALTPKAILIIFIFGGLLLLDRACAPVNQSMTDAQSRHEAAMKDLGKNDYVPVRNPWGDK